MNSSSRNSTTVALLVLATLAASCGGGGGSGSQDSGFQVVRVSHGFGAPLVPHQVFAADAAGFPTVQLVTIRRLQDLLANVTLNNPVLPPTTWPSTAVLPNGDPGNHFLFAEFTKDVDLDSILTADPVAQSNAGLTGSITVVSIDPTSGQSVPVPGRAFLGGQLFAGAAVGAPPLLPLQRWVASGAGGKPTAVPVLDAQGGTTFPGLGFPGTGANSFAGADVLVQPSTFVFVVDSDSDLSTFETFPTGRQIRMKVAISVRSFGGEALAAQAVSSTTVGPDAIGPEVITAPPPLSTPSITPGNGQDDVDPRTDVVIEFSEPVQPTTVGPFPSTSAPVSGSAVALTFGPPNGPVSMPFSALPVSVFDLSTYVIDPSFDFPGTGPVSAQCSTFSTVTVTVNQDQITDLASNLNTQPKMTSFRTGEGPGIVNAPVVPEAIYVTRGGATPSLSVIDLNGFGGSTGNPEFDFSFQTFPEGNTNFPNNPNVRIQGAQVIPPLQPGSCTVNGGSAGVFTLTKDSSLDNRLLRSPTVSSTGEVMIGQTLDSALHNGQQATGCQALGGGNLCAIDGKKLVQTSFTAQGTLGPPVGGQTSIINIPGGPNPVSFAPSPNPPPLVFPPLCIAPLIGGQESASIDNALNLITNLLVPGDSFGNPNGGVPPSGLLVRNQNAFFVGPSRPGQPLGSCLNYQVRQQIGHFLYMLDRARGEVVVLNSNRFTVLDRIRVPDPTSMAMDPNLKTLAVTNQIADSVTFINIDPSDTRFHRVVKIQQVGRAPRGIAWEPGNEDILVCNEGDSSVSIIDAFTFTLRKTVFAQLNRPFELAITPRQANFGFQRNVYFAWILNRDGGVALFESGPNDVNGWGFDDVIGTAPFVFNNPKMIQPEPFNLAGSVWIVHENEILADGTPSPVPGGAVSNLVIQTAATGQVPLNPSTFGQPQLRDVSFNIVSSIGPTQLTGVPVDIAFDDLQNRAATAGWATAFSPPVDVAELNSKSIVRAGGTGAIPTNVPQFMFLAVPNSSEGPGVIDVIDIESGANVRVDTNAHQPGTQSVPAPSVTNLTSYFRQ